MTEAITVATPIKMWMPDGTIETYYRTATEQIKAAIIGPPKGGKSRLASTAPKKPIYHFNYDGRLAALSGIPDNFGFEYLDTTDPSKSTAWAKVEADMQNFEYQKIRGNPIPGTFVFDPIDLMLERAERKFFADNLSNTTDVKQLLVGTVVFPLSKSWASKTADVTMVGNMIARAVELGADVIAIFHERAEETEDSNAKLKKFTGKVSVHPPRATAFLPLFNEYWRVLPNYEGIYEVFTKPNSEFVGGTCLKIDGKEPADMTTMLEKHFKNLEKEKQNA